MDLSNALTVFVVTVDDRVNLDDCIAHIERQDVTFVLERIERVGPMEAAFQCMLDRCRTPLFIQVDEDMMLEPWAVRTLFEGIGRAPPEVAILVRPLWDEHLKMPISGVKIYRHGIVSKFPYRSSASCEMDQVLRLEESGYSIDASADPRREDCCGRHGVHWTGQSIFDRYRNLMVKLRRFEWSAGFSGLPLEFMHRYEQDPTPLNRWAFLGAIAGLVLPLEAGGGEKDYRTYGRHPAFRRLLGLLSEGPTEILLDVTTMSPARVKSALEQFPEIQSARIGKWGDALKADCLGEIVEVVRRAGVRCSLCTDGQLLPSKLDEIRRWGVDELDVHVDLARVDEVLLPIIPALIELEKKIPPKPALVFSASLTRKTLPLVERLLDLTQRIARSLVRLDNLVPATEPDAAFWDEALVLDRDEDALEALRHHPAASHVTRWPVLIGRDGDRSFSACVSPWTSLGLDGEGNVTGCRQVAAPARSHGRLGATPETTWHNAHFTSLRLRLAAAHEKRAYRGSKSSATGPSELQCRACFECWKPA